jgi:hypothetical protein
MKPDKETIALAVAGGGLIALYALRKSGVGGLSGLGQTLPPAYLSVQGSNPTTSFEPSQQMFIVIQGGLKNGTDWVETNYTPGYSPGSFNPTFPSSWAPQFNSWVAASNAVNSWQAAATAIDTVDGSWVQHAYAPTTPGNYVVLVAVDGQIVYQLPFTVGGAPPQNAFQITSTPASQTPSSATTPATGIVTPFSASPVGPALVPLSLPAASSTSPGTAAAATTPVSSGLDLSSIFSSTMFGIPTWLLVLGAGGVIWYLTSREKS